MHYEIQIKLPEFSDIFVFKWYRNLWYSELFGRKLIGINLGFICSKYYKNLLTYLLMQTHKFNRSSLKTSGYESFGHKGK